MTGTSIPAVVDLDTVVDGQRVGRGLIVFLVVATCAMISDGFDLSAMGYVGPELVKAWHIAPAALVPAFSAGIIGLLLGAPLLGWFGDRYGRKRAIVIGLSAFGTISLATMAARTTTDLTVLRFLTGLGLGGVFPNVIALVAELSPRRIRGRMIVIIAMGVALGIALPGAVAATLVPHYGWRVLLLVGGVLPLVVALICFVVVPESIKFLLERGGRDGEVRRLAQRLRPDLAISAATRLTRSVAPAAQRGSLRALFAGDLAVVTPLLWLSNASCQLANFFALTWLPLLLQAGGATTREAGVGGSLFSLGGLAGGAVLLFVIDRTGVIPIVVLFVFGAPLVAAIGLTGLPPLIHYVVIAAAGLCVIGINFGITAMLGIFYPTAIRSIGTGWTQAIGRIGALAAPLAGGAMLALHLPMPQLLLAPAAALVVGAIACAVLARLCLRRFGGLHLAEFGTPGSANENATGF